MLSVQFCGIKKNPTHLFIYFWHQGLNRAPYNGSTEV